MRPYEIIDLEQGSDEWKEWRNSGVTATDSTILLGVSPYKSEWRLWAEKTGFCEPVDLSKNPHVRRGLALEDEARKIAEVEMNDMIIPICIQSKRWSWIRASLDGINSKGEPVELKNPSEKVWDDIRQQGENNSNYKMYRVQVLHQMLALESRVGWLVFHLNGKLQTFKIEADREVMAEIVQVSAEFYRRVNEKDAPEKNELEDWFIPQGDDAEKWVALSQAYRNMNAQAATYKDKIKLLEERQKEVSKELQSLMGSFRSADFGGLQVTRYVTKKTDYKQMIADSVFTEQQAAQYTSESERCRVTVNHNSVMPKHVKDEDACAPLEGLEANSAPGFV